VKRYLAVLSAVAAASLCAVPGASAATETAGAGPVTATLSYDKSDDYKYEHLHVKIARDGAVAIDEDVKSPECTNLCWPANAPAGKSPSIEVRDLDAGGEPEVLLHLYTGGAHCCSIAQVYSLTPGGPAPGYTKQEHNFLDPGYTVKDLNGDGTPEFSSADGRFAYAISSYAGTGMPVQILRFENGDFADVTGEFPKLIKADSKHYWKQYRRYIRKSPPGNDPGLGGLAAWAADEYRLGHGKRVERELRTALKRGWLDGPAGSGKRAVRSLHTLLDQAGYR
jgi:hypothetical protein